LESRQNGSVIIGDVTEQHLYGGPLIASGDDPNNDTKFASAASEYFK
jgi:hypothetical protein